MRFNKKFSVFIFRVCLVLTLAGFGGCGHHARRVCQRTPGLQRQTPDKPFCLAQNPQDFVQEEQLLHQDQAWRGLYSRPNAKRLAQHTVYF